MPEQVTAVSPTRRISQWLLLAASMITLIALVWWPKALLPDDRPFSHGSVSLLLAGLCLGLVTGSGLLQRMPAPLWWGAMVLSTTALIATAVSILQ